MGLFSWGNNKKVNAPMPNDGSESSGQTIEKFVKIENTEIYAIKSAEDILGKTWNLLENGEKDIQTIFDAAESGKVTDDLVEEMTNELTLIEKSRHSIIAVIEGVIEAAEETIRIESAIRLAAEHSTIDSEKLKRIKLIDVSERKILEDAKDMRKGMNKLILTVSEILELDPKRFTNDAKAEATKLRRKKSAMDVSLMKIKSDMAEIDAIIKDVVVASQVAYEIGLELGPALSGSIKFLTSGRTITGGIEKRKPNTITGELRGNQ